MNSPRRKIQVHVPVHLKLEQLESSLSKSVAFLSRRLTILESFILKEFGKLHFYRICLSTIVPKKGLKRMFILFYLWFDLFFVFL